MSGLLYGPKKAIKGPSLLSKYVYPNSAQQRTALAKWIKKNPQDQRGALALTKVVSDEWYNEEALIEALELVAPASHSLTKIITDYALNQPPSKQQEMACRLVGRSYIGGREVADRMLVSLVAHPHDGGLNIWASHAGDKMRLGGPVFFSPLLVGLVGNNRAPLRQGTLSAIAREGELIQKDGVLDYCFSCQKQSHWRKQVRRALETRLSEAWGKSPARGQEMSSLLGLFGINAERKDLDQAERIAVDALILSFQFDNLNLTFKSYKEQLAFYCGEKITQSKIENKDLLGAVGLRSTRPVLQSQSWTMRRAENFSQKWPAAKWALLISEGLVVLDGEPGQIVVDHAKIADQIDRQISTEIRFIRRRSKD